ncbi:MAG: ADP-ribosylglycohydrolase family protein [Methanosarcinales archaeon]|nr:ADP-ribosylglycohydrolase family protein [Methanosarcinales archaeon]
MHEKKYTGCLIGSAIGDALGMQTEGMTSIEIRQYHKYIYNFGPGRAGSPNEKLKPGQYTDDTEQTLILARSIIKSGSFDPELFSKELANYSKKIISDPELNRGWGKTSLTACKNLLEGIHWKESGIDTPTCGSAMRVSPIGLVFCERLDLLEKCAVLSSLPTHNNPQSIAGAVAIATAVSLAIKNTTPDIIIRISAELAGKYDPVLGNKIKNIESLKNINEINAFSIIGTSILTIDVVPSALYCFARYPLDFTRTILTAINAGGDTDSIAAIAGAISGAYLGKDAIPKKWLDGVESSKEIESIAKELMEISKTLSNPS